MLKPFKQLAFDSILKSGMRRGRGESRGAPQDGIARGDWLAALGCALDCEICIINVLFYTHTTQLE